MTSETKSKFISEDDVPREELVEARLFGKVKQLSNCLVYKYKGKFYVVSNKNKEE